MRIKDIIIVLAILLLIATSANAELFNRGTDSLGNRLIYDSDLNITWYDYSNSSADWYEQVNWASYLQVNFGGTNYNDWRLPDSDFCHGYDCTGSEIGHLYYTELGNPSGGPMNNTGFFLNLETGDTALYWSGTLYTESIWKNAMVFVINSGFQADDHVSNNSNSYAIAVRSGDVPDLSVVPEPISSTLFIVGGATFGIRRWKNRK
jgi:hypothetical protein